MTHTATKPTRADQIDAELSRLAPSWDEDAQARIAAYTADPVLFRVRRVIAEEVGL
jgi:hypothetical protein